MTDCQSLLAAVISNPNDDVPRTIYADELLDSDNHLDRALGEYIKLSVELYNFKKAAGVRVDNNLKDISFKDISHEDTMTNRERYEKGIYLSKEIDRLNKIVGVHPSRVDYLFNTDAVKYHYERGFVHSITCTATQFLSICGKLVWHESMVDTKDIVYLDMTGNNTRSKTIETPRPCPLTAHPVREIEITDYHRGNRNTVTIRKWRDELAPKYGIEFTIV